MKKVISFCIIALILSIVTGSAMSILLNAAESQNSNVRVLTAFVVNEMAARGGEVTSSTPPVSSSFVAIKGTPVISGLGVAAPP